MISGLEMLITFNDLSRPTHRPVNAPALCSAFKNIKAYFPETSAQVKEAMLEAWESDTPAFISLKRDNEIQNILTPIIIHLNAN